MADVCLPPCGAGVQRRQRDSRRGASPEGVLPLQGAGRGGWTIASGGPRPGLAAVAPRTTEEQSFQLRGLAWAEGDSAAIRRATAALLAEQRPEGGWAPDPARAPRTPTRPARPWWAPTFGRAA